MTPVLLTQGGRFAFVRPAWAGFRELDEWIRHRLGALHLRHWKRGRTTYREVPVTVSR